MSYKKYIVGGSVRDMLLNKASRDTDYVLVGCDEDDVQELLANGFVSVGKQFPVLLSPLGEEYALARLPTHSTRNRITATLEDDLYCRDLTINAIAYDPFKRRYIDPYHGIDDINRKILRHTSNEFKCDPVRIIRLARFLSTMPDFTVAVETEDLVCKMVKNGALKNVCKERIVAEFTKVEKHAIAPELFFEFLISTGAFEQLFGKNANKNVDILTKMVDDTSTEDTLRFLWSYIMPNISEDWLDVIGSHAKKFEHYIKRNGSTLLNFSKITLDEMVDVVNPTLINLNGGEEFLYSCLDYLKITDNLTEFNADLIIKSYDALNAIDFSILSELIVANNWTKADVTKHKNEIFKKTLDELVS